MEIRQYLDSTYLKTPKQAGLTEAEDLKMVQACVAEAIDEGFKLIMIRPKHVKMAREMVLKANSTLLVGTVIDFPDGESSIEEKLIEAEQAVADGADELDFVCNYKAFQAGETDYLKDEIFAGTQFALSHLKTVKWIIEVAALDLGEIARISSLIKNVVVTNFEGHYNEVFVKSSTGFYNSDGKPNGATRESIITMLENAAPLPVKAAGGIRNFEEAAEMVNLGVKRIGTSAAREIVAGGESKNAY